MWPPRPDRPKVTLRKGEVKKQKNSKTKPPIVREDSVAEEIEAITTFTGTKPKKRNLEKNDKNDKIDKNDKNGKKERKERKEKSKSKYLAS